MLDRNRLINPAILIFVSFESCVSLGAKRGSDVGYQNLGVYLLLNGAGQLSGEAFQVQAAFEGLECLFNVPASVIERAKLSCGVGGGIEQRGDQYIGAAGGQDHPNQAQTQHGARLSSAAGFAKLGQVRALQGISLHTSPLGIWHRAEAQR